MKFIIKERKRILIIKRKILINKYFYIEKIRNIFLLKDR